MTPTPLGHILGALLCPRLGPTPHSGSTCQGAHLAWTGTFSTLPGFGHLVHSTSTHGTQEVCIGLQSPLGCFLLFSCMGLSVEVRKQA